MGFNSGLKGLILHEHDHDDEVKNHCYKFLVSYSRISLVFTIHMNSVRKLLAASGVVIVI